LKDFTKADRNNDKDAIVCPTDYGRHMKPFFIKMPDFWAWADNLWHFWDFWQIYQHPFCYCETFVHVFS
jgi:hypothetical protein